MVSRQLCACCWWRTLKSYVVASGSRSVSPACVWCHHRNFETVPYRALRTPRGVVYLEARFFQLWCQVTPRLGCSLEKDFVEICRLASFFSNAREMLSRKFDLEEKKSPPPGAFWDRCTVYIRAPNPVRVYWSWLKSVRNAVHVGQKNGWKLVRSGSKVSWFHDACSVVIQL